MRIRIMSQAATNDIRPSPIAGRWYPGKAEQLQKSVDEYLASQAKATISGEVIGLIAPHAGHVYSGRIAADAFRLVKDRSYTRVIVIGPMHSTHPEPVLTTGHAAYQTPLGSINVDHETIEALRQRMPVEKIRNDPEHSLEIELPFLQRALAGPFSLVPLMLRDQSFGVAEKLGQAIAEVIGGRQEATLLVASSDLSHFYTEPQAHALDQIMLGHIERFDPEAVIRADDQGEAFACGRAAIATALVAARALGADRVKIVGYATSADAGADRFQVVGYGAAVITKG
jgi:hypothetical protein